MQQNKYVNILVKKKKKKKTHLQINLYNLIYYRSLNKLQSSI